MKTAKDFLDEAHQVVPKKSALEAIELHSAGTHVFIDVRDPASIEETGTIAGAHRVQRGMLEFMADDSTPFHHKALSKDANICLVCGKGGQAALSGKTLLDMGYTSVTNIGGIGDWIDAGGPIEK